MTALIIIASIALLFFILLASSITAELEYDKIFKFKIKYLFFTIAKDPLSPKEQKKKERKAEKKKRKEEKKKQKAEKAASMPQKNKTAEKSVPKEANQTDSVKKEQKPSDSAENGKEKNADKGKSDSPKKEKKKSGVTPDLIMRIFGKAKPHIKRLLKKIRISNVYVDIVVGGDDAAKTAISYGVHCAAVDGLVGFLDSMISFKAEKIGIRADFELEKSEYYARGTVKLRMSTLLHCGIWGALAVKKELESITADTEKDSAASDKAA